MSRHDDTLQEVFDKPTRANVSWRAVEAMLRHKGFDVKQSKGNGSATTIVHPAGKPRITVHRPHPGDQMVKEGVEDLRDWMDRIGCKPGALWPPVIPAAPAQPAVKGDKKRRK